MIDLTKSQLFSLDGTLIVQTPTPQQSPEETGPVAEPGFNAPVSLVPVGVGSIIDNKYKVTGLLGEGGMGTVYKAHHMLLNKDVALKTFKTSMLTENALQRFEREAKAIAKLNPTNIVHVFDFGAGENNVPYYTMECLEGQSLAEKLEQDGPLSADAALKIFQQVCRGLAEAHSKGIVHRDLKPANIFLTNEIGPDRSPRVKLVDFGVAGVIDSSLDGQKLTATGSIFGSPLYMSPEQSLGKHLAPSTDIYSCGCALFEALTGSPPFRGESAFVTMFQHQTKLPPTLAEKAPNKNFSAPLQALVYAMLEKDPEDRPATVDELAAVMSDILQSRPIAARWYKTAPANETADDKSVDSNEIDAERQGPTPPTHATKSGSRVVVFALTVLIATTIGAGYWFLNHKTTLQNSPRATKGGAAPVDSTKGGAAPAELPRSADVKDEPDIEFDGKANSRLGTLTEDSHSQNKKGLLLTAMEAPFEKPELFETEATPNLTKLKLSDSYKWTDRHLAHIAKLKNLGSLYLSNSAITDESIKYINALTKLTALEASGVRLSKSSIAQLKRLPNLNFLSLSNVPNLSGAFTSMARSKAPYYLVLCNCNLSDADVKVFSTLSGLHQLELKDNPRITNDGFLSLARLKHLAVLKVSGTAVTPEVIPKLKDFTALEELIVDMGSWSDSDRKRAQMVLPKHAKVDYSQEQKDRRDNINNPLE